jgi:hypothetical protein
MIPQHEIDWNIHELIAPPSADDMSVVTVYKNPDGLSVIPVSFFGCKYMLYPGLCWGGIVEDNDLIRICFTFPNERMSRNVILPSLRADNVMIDVGACYGSWTLPGAAMGMKVIAIEPDSYNAIILEQQIKLNGMVKRVTVVKKFAGKALLSAPVGKIIPIDHLVKELQLERVDFIKIDVEGMEFDVLYGAKKTINKFKPKLLVELHTMEHGLTVEDEKKFLTKMCPKLNYKQFNLSQKTHEDDKEYYHCYHYI